MNGRTTVITGASAGIGAVLADRASSAGGRTVRAARRERQLDVVAARCITRPVSQVTEQECDEMARVNANSALERPHHWSAH
jgi:short-subunit dehydrogenase